MSVTDVRPKTIARYSRCVVLYRCSESVNDLAQYLIGMTVFLDCFCKITRPTRTSQASVLRVRQLVELGSGGQAGIYASSLTTA